MKREPARVFLTSVVIVTLSAVRFAAASEIPVTRDPTVWMPLINGVEKVGLPVGSLNGSIELLTADWVPIVAGDEDSWPPFAIILGARVFGQGRVIAFGHEGWIRIVGQAPFDTDRLGGNVIRWLDVLGTKKVLGISGAWPSFWPTGGIVELLRPEGYSFSLIPRKQESDRLTREKLQGVSVLLLPSAFDFFNPSGYLAFNQSELNLIRDFVSGGGGLGLLGLGWSWAQYHDPSLQTFPLKPVGDLFGVAWTAAVVGDPTHNQIDPNTGNPDVWAPYFYRFYPTIPGTPEPIPEPSSAVLGCALVAAWMGLRLAFRSSGIYEDSSAKVMVKEN